MSGVDIEAPSASPPPAPRAHRSRTFFCAVLPVVGLVAELLTGMLRQLLSLFPTEVHVLAVMVAVGLNAVLHFRGMHAPELLGPRAITVGYIGSMALLYALVEAPALPLMMMLAVFVIGVLAMAPYLVLLGWQPLYRGLLADWRSARGSERGARRLVVIGAAAPLLLLLMPSGSPVDRTVRDLRMLHELLRESSDEERIDALAAHLRTGDVALQRLACLTGVRPNGRLPLHMYWPQLVAGEPFWFVEALLVRSGSGVTLSAADARTVFDRVHGQPGWERKAEPQVPATWHTSRYTITAEPEAALARVDHELELSGTGFGCEARLHVQLPPGAFASSLSAWIGGVERPAAFAGACTARKAYESVVSKLLDPVLLQQTAADRLLLRMGPLGDRFPAMRVRVGYTVPMVARDGALRLQLPRIGSHDCKSAPKLHTVTIGTATEQRTAERLAEPWSWPLPKTQTSTCTDADGVLVQTLRPRRVAAPGTPHVVLLEASASSGAGGLDAHAVLRGLGDGARCVLFAVHGRRVRTFEGAVDSPECAAFVRQQSFTGGVDPLPALVQAMAAAHERGVHTILWLHGAAGEFAKPPVDFAWSTLPVDVAVHTLALSDDRHELLARGELWPRVVPVPCDATTTMGCAEALRRWARFAPTADGASGELERQFARVPVAPATAVPVSDQLARLWANHEAAMATRADRPEAARSLARRYRFVTDGVSAVVLEKHEQYAAFGLDPGAPIGREPELPIGSGPVPEPATWLLLASGLAVACWLRRRRAA